MTSAFALEQFEQQPAAVRSRGALLTDFERLVIDEAEAELEELDEEEVAGSKQEIDEETVARRDAAMRFEGLMSEIEGAWTDSLQAAVAELAERTGRSLSALLPNLVSEFGAGQLAASVVAIVEKADLKSPLLLLSPEDHDCVISELSELASPVRIEVRKSLDQATGSAALKWEQGGADLDLSGFLTSAQQVFERTNRTTSNGEQET